MEFVMDKNQEPTPEQDQILRIYLKFLLMPCRKERVIHGILGEANALPPTSP